MFKTYFEDDDVKVLLEHVEGEVFVHLDVRRWAPSVLKKLLVVNEYLRKEVKKAGFKVLFAYNRNEDVKWYKFVEMFQFRALPDSVDGHTVYFSELK